MTTTRLILPGFIYQLSRLLVELEISHSLLPVTLDAGNGQSSDDKAKRETADSKFSSDSDVGRIILYMEEHISEELSLQKLAIQVELTKYQLIRRFQKATGSTPWKYLTGKRIEKAKSLLEDGMPPGHTAVESGFYDQSHLTRVFKEITGMTPLEYQKKNFRNRN